MTFDSNFKKPFDPSQLKVEVKNTTIRALCDMLANEIIDLQPDFQRHANLWSETKKSRFIESLILGIPIPSMFFYVDYGSKKWIVIDGLQRLCALQDFMVDQTLALHGLEFTQHDGSTFGEFSYFERLEMMMRDVTLNIISGEASKDAIYLIFKRLNSEGLSLRPAEIRNALYHGYGMDFVKQLAESDAFQKVIHGKVSTKRMMHYDFVARFISFYHFGYKDYPQNGSMDDFLGEALAYFNKSDSLFLFANIQNDFYRSLDVCIQLLGQDAFRSPNKAQDNKKRSNPISIALFEAMMCSVSHLTDEEVRLLLDRTPKYRELYFDLFKDKDLEKLLSQGTGKRKSVIYRFEQMEQIVKTTLS